MTVMDRTPKTFPPLFYPTCEITVPANDYHQDIHLLGTTAIIRTWSRNASASAWGPVPGADTYFAKNQDVKTDPKDFY